MPEETTRERYNRYTSELDRGDTSNAKEMLGFVSEQLQNFKTNQAGSDNSDGFTPLISRTVKDTSPTVQAPQSVDQIYGDMSRTAQKEINALSKHYSNLVDEQRAVNEERTRSTAAVNSLMGLAGSTEANQTVNQTNKENTAAIKALRDEQNLAVAQILGKVRQSAVEEARAQREDYRLDMAAADERRAAAKTEAIENASMLAASGVTAKGYAETDPEGYAYLAQQVGGDQVLQSMFTLNRPQESILDKRIENGKYVIAYQNPLDGKIRIETVDLGLPPQYTKTIDAGNRILAIPDNWDGDPSSLITINKGVSPTTLFNSGGGGGSSSFSSEGGELTPVQKDAQAIMDGVLNLQDVSTKDNYRALVARELQQQAQKARERGDVYGVMKASAAYDKEVSDTFLQSMEKTVSVLGQLGVLQENISGTDTGPIVGAFRGNNPWDTNAQTIKAQLNAIVPNLARGVYGEVGVLTDNDIRTYAKTLPNLTSTEEVRNAVLYITVDMIRRNVKTKIENQAAGQRDMSGYADVYRNLEATSNEILGTLPNANVAEAAIDQGKTVLVGPDGTEYDASELTEQEIEEAISAGYTKK